MSLIYDYEPSARGDPLVRLVENALHPGLAVMTPERATILKTFPFCEFDFFHEKALTFLCNVWNAVLKLPDWCWGSSIKRDAQISTNRTNEMVNVPFRHVQQHMVCIYFSVSINIDSILSKVDNSPLDQSSMVAENLQRMEKQDDASKPMFETALKNAAATAIVGG